MDNASTSSSSNSCTNGTKSGRPCGIAGLLDENGTVSLLIEGDDGTHVGGIDKTTMVTDRCTTGWLECVCIATFDLELGQS